MMADEMSPRRLERIGVDHDILERAKALRDDMDFVSDDCIKEHISELIAEVERLRSLNESLMENGNDLRTRCQKAEARIKELEADRIAYRNLGSRIEDLETYIEQLEAAFLKTYARLYYHEMDSDWDERPSFDYDEKARDALARIKEGGKDEQL